MNLLLPMPLCGAIEERNGSRRSGQAVEGVSR